jgi:hypothetical protein
MLASIVYDPTAGSLTTARRIRIAPEVRSRKDRRRRDQSSSIGSGSTAVCTVARRSSSSIESGSTIDGAHAGRRSSSIGNGSTRGMAITDNPRLVSVTSLDTIVRGSVNIERNPLLVGVFGSVLTELDGWMVIEGNDSLAHLDLPLLEQVASDLIASGNAGLQTR